MLGKLISNVIKVATIPVDVLDIGIDMVSGGDGSKRSRQKSDCPMLSNLRDRITEAVEEIDH